MSIGTEQVADDWRISATTLRAVGEFVGSGELEDLLGVSRQRVYQLTRAPGFPEPVAELKAGAIWRTADVVAWAKARGRAIVEEEL